MLTRLLDRAAEREVGFPSAQTTPDVNTIPASSQPDYPGDRDVEGRIEAVVRWNTTAMVTRANANPDGVGGHMATPASSSSLYEMGHNHFFRGKDDGAVGDQIYFQGHASPGVYARAFVEGRLSEDQLDRFRREIGGGGLSSYPHPRLMPDFWEFPTVSMGLGPICSIYQARFNRYLANRGIADTSAAKVWCFIGDGECDDPETLGAISLAAREGLDNLIFVINCNLQRLDGPVRGNGKIIQELEGVFRGAGWDVIKVVWGGRWDELLARDVDDDPLLTMPRGGHDHEKLYAAYAKAVAHTGSPTVILTKTVKGSGLGPEIEGRNAAHQMKKMPKEQLLSLRERLGLADLVSDEDLEHGVPPYLRFADGSPEAGCLLERRGALGGSVPRRVSVSCRGAVRQRGAGRLQGPVVAITDFMKAVPDQVARWVPGALTTLGTDGYGRSDSRAALRRHFETDAPHLVVAVLAALADLGDAKPEEVADAIARHGLDPEAIEPWLA